MESPGFMFDGAVLEDERPISGASLPPVRPVSDGSNTSSSPSRHSSRHSSHSARGRDFGVVGDGADYDEPPLVETAHEYGDELSSTRVA